MTINDLRTYYDSEYNSTKLFLTNIPAWANEKETIGNTLQRMIGAAMLAQNCGVEYSEVDELYYEYRHKIEELRGDKNV